jgi:DNA-binding transcriptional ArsR family regulator
MSFALLADPTRVQMLWALRNAELDVATLAAVASCRPTVARQHLSKLRFAGLVEASGRASASYSGCAASMCALLTEALFQADHHAAVPPYTTSAAIPADRDGALR